MKVEQFGFPGHFVCGWWCRFHITTVVGGKYLISTVGKLVHPRNAGLSEKQEFDYLDLNPEGEEIGAGRHYETMVFKTGTRCHSAGCDCGMPAILGNELEMRGYNDAGSATRGHAEMVEKYQAEAGK